MTKRKRDVLTVIESINDWFEASDTSTTPTTDLEGSFSGSELGGISAFKATTTEWEAANSETVGDSVPWEGVSQVSLGGTELGTKSKVAADHATYLADGSRVPEVARAVTEEGPATVSEPGRSGEDNRPIPQLGTGVTREADVNPNVLWDLLRTVGYDVW